MEDASKAQNRTLELDWNVLLTSKDDDEPIPLLIVKADTSVADSEAHPRKNSDMGFDQQHPSEDGIELLSDHALGESIQRLKHTLSTMARKLNDGGEKVRNKIKRLEEELERRKMRIAEKEADECEKPGQVTSSSTVGVSHGLKKEDMSSQAHSQSSFATCFCKKITEDTNCVTVNEFDKESLVVKHCGNPKFKENGVISQKGRKRDRSSSRQLAFQCPSRLSKHDTSDNSKTCRATSPFSPCHIQKNLSSCFPKIPPSQVVSQVIQLDDSKSRKGQPIVLDDDFDEDESHLVDKTKQEDKLAKHLKDAKIYYPSRDDPESVEICFTDIDCLAPEGYLTSTIMNFYIQYLQQQKSLTNMSTLDYHFFNTYFYKKLKEAVSYKSDREGFFVKFRRWWKGVNIFHKAYILIPIHEDLHWSLVIICIPDKDDESWPIILHLDSLGLHSSRSIFENIRRFLREEWKYVDRECGSSDIPIADRIWKSLPRGIEEKILKVPQQKNDYDCGLFVLYFIQRFIDGAPERLKKKDLAKFGKQWFKPEEASSLRSKIHSLLRGKFKDLCNQESSPESSSLSVTATECVETTNNS